MLHKVCTALREEANPSMDPSSVRMDPIGNKDFKDESNKDKNYEHHIKIESEGVTNPTIKTEGKYVNPAENPTTPMNLVNPVTPK